MGMAMGMRVAVGMGMGMGMSVGVSMHMSSLGMRVWMSMMYRREVALVRHVGIGVGTVAHSHAHLLRVGVRVVRVVPVGVVMRMELQSMVRMMRIGERTAQLWVLAGRGMATVQGGKQHIFGGSGRTHRLSRCRSSHVILLVMMAEQRVGVGGQLTVEGRISSIGLVGTFRPQPRR